MKEVNYQEYIPIVISEYPQYDLESVLDLDDIQFAFLVNGLSAIHRLRAANAVPGMIDGDSMKQLQAAAPQPRIDSDGTFLWLQEQCVGKGISPPVR